MKTLFDIESYRTRFLGGARQYLFFVLFTFPEPTKPESSGWLSVAQTVLSTFGLGAEQDKFPYLVKSTILPSYGLNEVVTPYTKFDLKTAGYPSYGDWTVTMNIDEKGEIVERFFNWMEICETSLPDVYMKDQQIHLVDYQGSSFFTYKLFGAWPKAMSQVTLDYGSSEIATLEVTFSYQYFDVSRVDSVTESLIKQATNKIAGMF